MKSKLVVIMKRFVVDFKYPLPHIEDISAAIQGEQLFTKLDLSGADNQILLNDDAEEFCTVSSFF